MESKKQANSLKRRSDLWLPETEGWGARGAGLVEGGQKIHISSSKISTGHIMYNTVTKISTALWYIGKLLRVNPKSSHHKKKNFFYFLLFFSAYLYEIMS